MWDLDSQGGATYALRGEQHQHASAKKLLAGKRELPELILATGYAGLDLLPADFSYRNFAVHLAARRHPTERLLKMSRSLREVYGALFLDCPAGISLLSENVLRAADVVIVPLVPAPFSLRMLSQLQDFIASEGWGDLLLLPFFSMVDRRRSLHQELIASAREQFPHMLATEVPDWSEIERMSVRRSPLGACAPRSEAALIYAQAVARDPRTRRGRLTRARAARRVSTRRWTSARATDVWRGGARRLRSCHVDRCRRARRLCRQPGRSRRRSFMNRSASARYPRCQLLQLQDSLRR